MKNSCSIDAAFGKVTLNLPADNTLWRASLSSKDLGDGISEIIFSIDSETPQTPPECRLSWSFPQCDTAYRWYVTTDRRSHIPPNWASTIWTQLAFNAPLIALYSQGGMNRMTFAFSEAMREVASGAGVNEFNSEIDCFVKLFSSPEAPLTHYSARLRVNTRDTFYADAIHDAFDWYATMKEYAVSPAPPEAFDLLYSSWYSYHKEGLKADTLEKQVSFASKFGMKSIIVDDGWQTDRYDGGPYAYCGDWQNVPSRFPNMKQHVENIHKQGFKYILWYSVPFVGEKSVNFERFKGKYLFSRLVDAHVLDPRFPCVRDYLISTYEDAVRNWDLDGFKLDFIDSFPVAYENDPAVKEDFGNGRDCKSVSEGVDKLMTGVMERLRALKKDILIEFRQNYTGPAIRKYGNMLRAGDCPGDILSNRVRTLDLRITTSEKTAVHADMITWNYNESPESAARQILAVLFSVPQISVRLEEIPESHTKMLEFWLGFWQAKRDLLLFGYLKPFHPELSYPYVVSEREDEEIHAVYESISCITVSSEKSTSYIVNASESDSLVIELAEKRCIETFDVTGAKTASFELSAGLSKLKIPVSGLAVLKK